MDSHEEFSALIVEIGPINRISQECPGIYYLIAGQDGEPVAAEYYAVADMSIISR